MPEDLKKLPEWKELYVKLRDEAHGKEFTHKELAGILGIAEGTWKYTYSVGRCNKELRANAQRYLVSIQGRGYRIALPNEHAELCVGQVKRGHKALQRGAAIITATDVRQLSAPELGDLQRTADCVARIESKLVGISHERQRLIAMSRGLLPPGEGEKKKAKV